MNNINLDEILNYIILFLVGFIFFSYLKKSNNVTEYFKNPDKKCPRWMDDASHTRQYTDNCSTTTGCTKYYSINRLGNAMPCFQWVGGCALLGGESGKTYSNYRRNECK